MLEIHTTLTNEEAESLREPIGMIDNELVRRMSTGQASRHPTSATAWVAFHKLTQAIRDHLRKLGAK